MTVDDDFADDAPTGDAPTDGDDLPTTLTRLLRNLDGVHTVYATKPIVPTIIGAVAEALRHEAVGMHLVGVEEQKEGMVVIACLGVTADEPAPDVCRRAHDALRDYFVDLGISPPTSIEVTVGRVG